MIPINIQIKKSWQETNNLKVELTKNIEYAFKNIENPKNKIIFYAPIKNELLDTGCPHYLNIYYGHLIIVNSYSNTKKGAGIIKKKYSDTFLGKKINNYSTNWEIKNNKVFINNNNFNYPFYLFDNTKNNLSTIKNITDFKKFIYSN